MRLWKHALQTVRPRSSVRVSWLFAFLMFGLTAAVVYRWGHKQWTPVSPEPTYHATAFIVESEGAGKGEKRIPVDFYSEDSKQAEAKANAQAEQYVKERLAEWKKRTEGPCVAARKAVEKAQGELAHSEALLESFRQELDAKQRAVKPKAPPAPQMIDNPAWVELDQQRMELQRRRDSLLVDRTPLHPAVRDIVLRMEDLQRQMAEIPRQITDPHPQAVAEPADNVVTKQDREKLSDLTAAVEKARWTLNEAESAEQQAIKERQTGPQYSIVYAKTVEIPPTPDYGWRRLIWTTFVAGALMAFGVGSVSTGSTIDPPVTNSVEVKAITNAAILGTIPAENPVKNIEALCRRQSQSRWTRILVGVLLIAASPLAAVWGVLGI